jgi:hypothetical protein
MLAEVVQAQTIIPGVEPGMSFVYTLTSYWESSELYAAVPNELAIINYTTNVEVKISSVNSTNIAIVNPWYYTDGTSSLELGNINLYTGAGYGFVGIIAANLNVDDTIHPNGDDGLKILDTTTRNYGEVSRETNHVCITGEDKETGYKSTRNLYFDKKTGILVEQIDTATITIAPFETSQIIWKLSYANGVDDWIFSVPSSGNTTIIATIAIVTIVTIAVILFIVYKKKSSIH